MYCKNEDCPMCMVMREVDAILTPLVEPSEEYEHRLMTTMQTHVLTTVVNRWLDNEMILGGGIVKAEWRRGGYVEFVEVSDVLPE
jgi:hypothetical protein